MEAFEQGLRDAGYAPGLNLTIDLRYPLSWVDPRRDELLRALAAEMASRPFDVIVAAWNPAIAAVRRTVANTPVVMVGAIDPVGNGFVSSTSRPGANMTRLMWDIGFTKQLDVLKEAVPKSARVAVLRDPSGGWGPDYWREAEVAAAARGLTIRPVEIRGQGDLETAIQHLDAIVIWDGQLFWQHSGVILGFARASHLPVMASSTAKTLGLSIPSSLLQWADVVIE